MSEKRYVLHPGNVISANDGQRHYVNAERLAWLYRVPMSECFVDEHTRGGPGAESARRDSAFIHLWPRYDSVYSLPAHSLHEVNNGPE